MRVQTKMEDYVGKTKLTGRIIMRTGKVVLPHFDGGMARHKDYDQYVASCTGGGENLHVLHMGSYPACGKCESMLSCLTNANAAGAQCEP
jgi:hypothetical protein